MAVLRYKQNGWMPFALWMLLVLIPMEGLVGSLAFQVAGAMAVMSAAGRTVRSHRIRRLDMNDMLALAFALWGIASFFWTQSEGVSLRALITQIQLVVFLFLLRSAISTPATLLTAMQGYTVGSLVVALFTIGAYVHVGIAGSRYSAGSMNPGFVGGALALGVPAAMLLIVSGMRWQDRGLGLAYLPVGALAIILTGTRTSAFATLAGLLAFARSLMREGRQHRRWILCAIFLLAVGVGLVFEQMPNLAGIARLSSTWAALSSRQLSGRERIWPVAIDAFLQHPLAGVGMGAFSSVAEGVVGYRIVTHNSWLSVAAELGLVGLSIFSLMTIRMMSSPMRANGLLRTFGWSLAATWLVNASMGTDTYLKTTWMVYGIISALPTCSAADDGG